MYSKLFLVTGWRWCIGCWCPLTAPDSLLHFLPLPDTCYSFLSPPRNVSIGGLSALNAESNCVNECMNVYSFKRQSKTPLTWLVTSDLKTWQSISRIFVPFYLSSSACRALDWVPYYESLRAPLQYEMSHACFCVCVLVCVNATAWLADCLLWLLMYNNR